MIDLFLVSRFFFTNPNIPNNICDPNGDTHDNHASHSESDILSLTHRIHALDQIFNKTLRKKTKSSTGFLVYFVGGFFDPLHLIIPGFCYAHEYDTLYEFIFFFALLYANFDIITSVIIRFLYHLCVYVETLCH
jgi:hypothetical protein